MFLCKFLIINNRSQVDQLLDTTNATYRVRRHVNTKDVGSGTFSNISVGSAARLYKELDPAGPTHSETQRHRDWINQREVQTPLFCSSFDDVVSTYWNNNRTQGQCRQRQPSCDVQLHYQHPTGLRY